MDGPGTAKMGSSLLTLPHISLPNIVLPKEPTKDFPSTLTHNATPPKILWNEDVVDKVSYPNVVATPKGGSMTSSSSMSTGVTSLQFTSQDTTSKATTFGLQSS